MYYGYRTLSYQSFDFNFGSLDPSVAKMHVLKSIPSMFLHFTPIPKDFINIHENETQITYLLQYGWYNIALAII